MGKMQKNLKIDRRVLMKNEVPVKKTVLERLRAKEKAFDQKRVLLYHVKTKKIPIDDDDRKYYAVDPENLIILQKARLLKQDDLMKDMRMDFNTQRTKLEKKINTMEGVYRADIENLQQKMKTERRYCGYSIAILCLTIILMMFI